MADKKVSGLSTQTTPASEDLLLIIDDPNGVPASKKITLKTLFGNVTANTDLSGAKHIVRSANSVFTANVNITNVLRANTFIRVIATNPSTNNTTTEGWKVGEMRVSNTYLYMAMNATTIKRVPFQTF
jgi:hypothetical protein